MLLFSCNGTININKINDKELIVKSDSVNLDLGKLLLYYFSSKEVIKLSNLEFKKYLKYHKNEENIFIENKQGFFMFFNFNGFSRCSQDYLQSLNKLKFKTGSIPIESNQKLYEIVISKDLFKINCVNEKIRLVIIRDGILYKSNWLILE